MSDRHRCGKIPQNGHDYLPCFREDKHDGDCCFEPRFVKGEPLFAEPSMTPERKRALEQVENWFTYHAPTVEQTMAYEIIRLQAMALAVTLLDRCPPSADRTVALRQLRECVATANASIACGGK